MSELPKCARPTCTRRAKAYGYCDEHATALGLKTHYVPITRLLDSINELRQGGWTLRQIAEATGYTRRRIHHMTGQEQVSANIVTKFVNIAGTPPPPGNTTPSWPYTRRLQSLRAAGHQNKHIAEQIGVNNATISVIANDRVVTGRINADTARRIEGYWQKHWRNPVTAPRQVHDHWVVPMWWDNIDDPDEQPGVSHCYRCHTGLHNTRTGLCESCQKHRYRTNNAELIRQRRADYYRRKKAERNAA